MIFVFNLLFLSVFIINSFIMTDADFGWALRLGEDILRTGIPMTDPYSYSMPSHLFVDHEWLAHSAGYLLYSIHPLVLYLGYGILLLLAVRIATKSQNKLWQLINTLLVAAVLLPSFIPKPHIISLLFVVLLMKMLQERKYSNYIPLLFIVWANLHGGFLYGLGVLTLYLATDMLQQRKINTCSIILIVTSFMATLLNPYGPALHQEVLTSVLDPQLRWRISEWRPAISVINLSFILTMGLYLTLVLRTWKSHCWSKRAVFFVTFLLGLSSLRNFALWVIIAAPSATSSIEQVVQSLKRIPGSSVRFNQLLTGLFLVVCVVFIFQLRQVELEIISRDSARTYPIAATDHIKQNDYKGRIFSTYEWGGYLIWKLPQRRVFIDGRMPSWRRDSAPPGESLDALGETYDIFLTKRPLTYYFDKYEVRYVLIPKTLLHPNANQYKNAKTFAQAKTFAKQLRSITRVVYEDDVAVLLERKDL